MLIVPLSLLVDKLSTNIWTERLTSVDNQKIWQKILRLIKTQISPINHGWFINSDLEDVKGDKIIISVPTIFFAENLTRRFLDQIEQSASETLGKKVKVEFKVDSSKLAKSSQKKAAEQETEFELPFTESKISYSLNPKFTLDNFVVGLSNNVAFAAAQAVVQNPGTSYNPLLIYGGTGVGKTHLMLGIGNAILQKDPHIKVIYCPSETFMNDYVEAIQTHRMGDLRRKYRQAGLLLIDDVQFFSGREGTQEEFFHTFNELHSRNSQMILTSDRPPQEIAKLEDRLKSRFAGGLMVDIQSPDFDTRVAILRAKCAERGENLPEETLKLLASSLETNIRELEGKLIQILQTLKTHNLPPTPQNIIPHLQSASTPKAGLDYKKVMTTVCSYFDLSQKDLSGPKRQKELVLPRHIVMFMLCEEMGLTVEKVGQVLGGRDHTTVMHGRDRIKKLLTQDREIQKMFIEIKQRMI